MAIKVATQWYKTEGGQWRYDLGKKKRVYNDRELYNPNLTLEEKRAIQKYIESLPEETTSKKPLFFTNNNYIYMFNTLLSRYEENREDGETAIENIHSARMPQELV